MKTFQSSYVAYVYNISQIATIKIENSMLNDFFSQTANNINII